MRRISTLLAAAGIALAGAFLAPVAQAAPAEECTTTITGGTVGSLVVPEGETCTLIGVTVEGSVTVKAGASLFTNDLNGVNTRIEGNVFGRDARTVRLIDTDVIGQGTTGNINLQRTTGPIVIGVEDCRVDPQVGNNITLINNLGTIAICQMTVGETITLQGNAKNIGVFDNVVGNSLIITGNTGEFIRVRRNEVGVTNGGSLTVKNNDSNVRLVDNTVANKLTCSGNTPPPSGARNTAGAGGSGQCASLA
jgi:hypothetical protein